MLDAKQVSMLPLDEQKIMGDKIVRYLFLVDEFLSIDHGVAWTPETGERESNLRVEIAILREELGMEPIKGFSIKHEPTTL